MGIPPGKGHGNMDDDRIGRLTRRQMAAKLGVTLAALTVPGRLYGQSPPDGATPRAEVTDGFSLLRPKFGMARLRGPDKPATLIEGYDAVTPGPLLRVRQGREVRARLINGLPDPTAVHWHGVRLPSTMDGAMPAQPPVLPGASFDYRFTPPDAGTFWYHAPSDLRSAGRGLYGALIVDEREPVAVDRDVLLVLDDWRLDAEGILGREGSHLTANGAPEFDIPVKTNERVRLRLVNAALGRIIALRLDRHRAVVMAIDGQPAQPFTANGGRVVLGPGNRIDLFIDMTMQPGEAVPLVAESHRDRTIARFVYDAGPPARPAVAEDAPPLPANPLSEKMDLKGAFRFDVPIDVSSIVLTAKPMFSVRRGRTVVLALNNRTPLAHAVHLHGHHFRLLDRLDDGWKPFWLDTLLLPPRQNPEQIWTIALVADNPGEWALERQMIGAAETASSSWFEVT